MKLPANYNNLHYTERKKAREEYILLQKGLCYYCGRSLTEKASNGVMMTYINKRLFPESFFKWPMHLHHDHNTGMTIGVVHCHCNAVLWRMNRNCVSGTVCQQPK